MLYALIDANDALIRKQDFPERPSDPVGKGWRWVPVKTVPATPGAGQERDIDTEDLEGDAWVIRQHVRAMTAEEVESLRVASLRDSDARDMARMVEDIMVIVAKSGGVSLSRASFPEAVWDKVNARRALRGQEPV